MFGRDELVLHLLSLLLRCRENLRKTGTEVLLAALDPRKASDGGLAVVLHDLNIRAQFSEQRTHDAFWLLEHCAEKVLRFDLLILIALGEVNAGLNGFLSAKRGVV